MTENAAEAAAAVRMLIAVAKQESRALSERNFSSLAQLAEKKNSLVTRLERAIVHGRGAPRRDLAGDLELLRGLSAETAAQMTSLRESVARARSRLARLAAADMSSGVYGEHGQILRVRETGGRSA